MWAYINIGRIDIACNKKQKLYKRNREVKIKVLIIDPSPKSGRII